MNSGNHWCTHSVRPDIYHLTAEGNDLGWKRGAYFCGTVSLLHLLQLHYPWIGRLQLIRGRTFPASGVAFACVSALASACWGSTCLDYWPQQLAWPALSLFRDQLPDGGVTVELTIAALQQCCTCRVGILCLLEYHTCSERAFVQLFWVFPLDVEKLARSG